MDVNHSESLKSSESIKKKQRTPVDFEEAKSQAKRGAMEDMIYKGSILRIKKCAFDLLSLEEDLIDDDEDSWELMGRDLRLKSTFLYCDLNHVISNAPDEHKKNLTDLGNKLFFFMEELDQAVKSRSISLIQIRYNDAAHVLQEVIMSLH